MTVIEDRWWAGHDHAHDPAPGPDERGDGEVLPAALFQNLAADGRFRRDSWWGRVLHPRTVSYREARATDSVHLVISDDKVSVHIDRFSPLAVQGGRSWRRYAPLRMLVHAVVDVAGEAASLVRGRHQHLHDLTCERVWVDDDAVFDDDDDARRHDSDSDCGDGDGDDAADADAHGECVPFNVADEAVHLLDSEAEPSSVHIEARVAGRLDDGRLRAAVAAAVARHPLARARRAPFQWSDYQFQWQIDPVADADSLSVVDCGDEADLAEARKALQSVSVPLAGSPPLRVVLAHHRSGDVVMVNAHQAATDGFGALRFLRSVARAYAGVPDPVPDLDLLAARNLTAGVDHASGPGPGRSAQGRRARDVFDRLGDLAAPPARIATDGGRATDGYGFHLVSLSQDETQALAGLDHPGTVTDLLLSALTLTIAGWNAEHGIASRRISVLVRANLRPSRWSGEMVGNFSGPGRVSTRPQAWATRRGTLAAISAQSSPQRRPGMATALTEALGGSPLLPLWAKQAMSPLLAGVVTRLAGTAVLADLGTLHEPLSFGTEAGAATAVHFSDPTHMPVGVSLGVVTAGGRLHLTFRHRYPQFDDAAAGRFADRFLAELAALVADFGCGRGQGGAEHPEPDQDDVSQSA